MTFSILIPTIDERRQSFKDLVLNLTSQAIDGFYEEKVEIITMCDRGLLSIGAKRNELLKRATGEYMAFIDDDDTISRDYIQKIMTALQSNPDCCSLTGVITWDGTNPELFEHSVKYSEYKTNPPTMGIRYERYPNHLNTIRTSIAQQFSFPETNHGEDTDFATQIFKSGLLKTEAVIDGIIYHYQFKSVK